MASNAEALARERTEEGASEEAGCDAAHGVGPRAGKTVLRRDRVEKVIGETSCSSRSREDAAKVINGRVELRR